VFFKHKNVVINRKVFNLLKYINVKMYNLFIIKKKKKCLYIFLYPYFYDSRFNLCLELLHQEEEFQKHLLTTHGILLQQVLH
jgi:hypothetical protein